MHQWRDASTYLLPSNGRFLTSERNRGESKHNKIYDSTGTRANRTLAAGLMAGMTSPARPWFRLATADIGLMQKTPVKLWLNQVTEMMRSIFSRSNAYRALHMVYEELGVFGTGATLLLPNFDNVIHHSPLTIGEYAIATNHLGEVDTIYREFEMTVSQIVGQFGVKNVSPTVKNLWDLQRGDDTWVPITHVIQPRTERDPKIRDAKNMPIASCYFESGATGDSMLRQSGFKRFPALVPRWSATGGDVYGGAPGREALGDIKQLQHAHLRKAQGIDYMVKPPVQAPSGSKGNEVNNLPGGVSYYDGTTPGIKNTFDVRLDLSHLLLDIQDIRERINDTFYKPLFLMMANDQRSGITAREVAERHEEKLLMLGPVLERLHNELLKKKIDATFDMMLEAGIVPPAPRELQGQEVSVEFVSMLAQAQRAIGTGAIDRYAQSLGFISALPGKVDVTDKFDADEWADQYADMLGVDPTLVVGDEKVALIRQGRAQAQAAIEQQAKIDAAAKTAQTMSQTDTSGQNGLSDIIGSFSGYGGPGQPYAS